MKKIIILILLTSSLRAMNNGSQQPPANPVVPANAEDTSKKNITPDTSPSDIQQLWEAVETNNKAKVAELLKSGVDVNAPNKDKIDSTVLMVAAAKGYDEIIQLLHQHQANLNAKNNHDATALMQAAAHDRITAAQLLISLGAAIDVTDINGMNALAAAAWWNRPTMIKMLHSCRADINLPDKMGRTPLMHTSARNNINALVELIKLGADIHAQNNEGDTALIVAAKKGHINALRYLHYYKADVNAKNKQGRTALICAAQINKYQVIPWLIFFGADVNAQDQVGGTALIYGTVSGYVNLVKMLLKVKNIDINIHLTSSTHYPAWAVAVRHNQIDTLRYLLAEDSIQLYADNNAVSIQKFGQFFDAIAQDSIKQLILNKDLHGEFFAAVIQKNSNYCNELADRVKDLLFFDSAGNNLMHYAIRAMPNLHPHSVPSEKVDEYKNCRAILALLMTTNPDLLWEHDNKAGVRPIEEAVKKPELLELLFDVAYADQPDTHSASTALISANEKYIASAK